MTWRWHVAAVSVAAVLLVLLIGPLFGSVADQLPFGPHDWKQSDCLAVADRFLQDGSWNIFDPRVLSRFPVESRVNIELPLAPYLAALSTRAAGDGAVAERLRTITLVISMLGPLALFLLVWTRTRSFLASIAPTAFLAGSPVVVYYAVSSLPDAPGLGLSLAGMALLLGGSSSPSQSRQVTAIAVMTLAGLVKMSFAPYLLVPAVLLLRQRGRGSGASDWLGLPPWPTVALVVSAVALAAQVVALRFREWVYWPTFCTSEPVPVASLHQLVEVVRVMRHRWLGDLFSGPQLIVLAAALAVVVARRLLRGPGDDLDVALVVAAAVAVTLFVLFGRQLAYHDYYAIAIAGPIAALLVVRLALEVWRWREANARLAGQIGLDLVLLGVVAASVLPLEAAVARRTTPWWRVQNEWLRDARADLDRCGERCAGPVAVVGSIAPNLGLVYLGRQGYSIGFTEANALDAARFASFKDAVRFLDAHRVAVLVVRRQVLKLIPGDELRRDFTAVDETGEGCVFIRRAS